MSIVNPRQTILVTTRSHATIMGREVLKDNITATDWHSPVSHHPLVYGIFIGNDRISRELIEKSKVFIVNFIPKTLEKAAKMCRERHGHHMDKFIEGNVTKEEGTSVDCPRIKEALAYLECELIFQKEFGDHVFFAGKVRSSDVKRDGKRLFHVSEDKYTTTV